MGRSLSLTALPAIPLIEPGDDLMQSLAQSLADAGLELCDGDVLVIAQKIISKAEDRYVELNSVEVSEAARELAIEADKDPRLVELIVRESKQVLRARPGVIIVEHNRGWVHANAGIDRSNIDTDPNNPRVLLLPIDPDASAADLRNAIRDLHGVDVAVIINDSAGRAWRNGIIGFALGTAGFDAIEDKIGTVDLFDRPLEVTQVAVADELAAAASFLMGQGSEGSPVVLIRGADLQSSDANAQSLLRPESQDLFR